MTRFGKLVWAPLGLGLGLSHNPTLCLCGFSRYRTTYHLSQKYVVRYMLSYTGLAYKYASSAPYDISQIVCNTIPYRRLPDSIKGCTAGRTRPYLVLQEHTLLCVFINKTWLGSARQNRLGLVQLGPRLAWLGLAWASVVLSPSDKFDKLK